MKVLDKIEEAICIICLLAMTTLVFANVFSRYVLHLSLSFSEEITTNLFVLLSMMGTAIAARRRAHLGLSILTDAVSPKLRRAMLIFGFGLATVFSFAVFFYGVKMVRSEYILRFAQITLEEIRTPAEGLKSDAELMIENAAAEERARLEKEEEK